jgi:hypothetical protein
MMACTRRPPLSNGRNGCYTCTVLTVHTIILGVFSPMLNAKFYLSNTINEAMRHFKPYSRRIGACLGGLACRENVGKK